MKNINEEKNISWENLQKVQVLPGQQKMQPEPQKPVVKPPPAEKPPTEIEVSDDWKKNIQRIKEVLYPYSSASEFELFIRTAISSNANPFKNEIFLAKFSETEPMKPFFSIHYLLKLAKQNINFDGMQSGVCVTSDDGYIERQGLIVLTNEKLIGGWSRFFRKDRAHATYVNVPLEKFIRRTKEGKPMRLWASMPEVMIEKVAMAFGLRRTFEELEGYYIKEEGEG